MFKWLRRRRGRERLRPLEAILLSCLEQKLKPEAARRFSLQLDAIRHVYRPRNLGEICLYFRTRQLESVMFPVRDTFELARIRFSVEGRKEKWTARIACVRGHVFSIVVRPSPHDIMDCNEINVAEVTLLGDPMDVLELTDESTGSTVFLYGWVREWYESYGGVAVREPPEEKVLGRWLRRVHSHVPTDYLWLLDQTNGMVLLDGKCEILPVDELVGSLSADEGFLDLIRCSSGTAIGLKLGDFTGDLFQRSDGGTLKRLGNSFQSVLEAFFDDQREQAGGRKQPDSGGAPRAAIPEHIEAWLAAHGAVGLSPALRAEKIEHTIQRVESQLPEDYVELIRSTEGLALAQGGIQVMGIREIDELHLASGDYYRLAEIADTGVLCVRRGDTSGNVYFAGYDGSAPCIVSDSFLEAVDKFC